MFADIRKTKYGLLELCPAYATIKNWIGQDLIKDEHHSIPENIDFIYIWLMLIAWGSAIS